MQEPVLSTHALQEHLLQSVGTAQEVGMMQCDVRTFYKIFSTRATLYLPTRRSYSVTGRYRSGVEIGAGSCWLQLLKRERLLAGSTGAAAPGAKSDDLPLHPVLRLDSHHSTPKITDSVSFASGRTRRTPRGCRLPALRLYQDCLELDNVCVWLYWSETFNSVAAFLSMPSIW